MTGDPASPLLAFPGRDEDDLSNWDVFDPEFDDAPPPPQWALDAATERDREALARAATEPVDAESLTALADADLAALGANGVLDAVAVSQRVINYAQAVQQRALAAFARPGVATPLESLVDAVLRPEGNQDQPFRPLADAIPDDLPVGDDGAIDFAPLLGQRDWRLALTAQAAKDASAEVGCLLNLAPITARNRTEKALTVVDGLPATLAAQQRGDLDGYRAGIIADRTSVLSREQCRDVESRLLPVAQKRTAAALRRLVDREVNAADPDAAARREKAARRRRGVTLTPDEDGLAGLHLTASAPDAALVHGVLDSIATSVRSAGLADGRGAGQLRADAMVDLFRTLNDTGHAHIGTPTTETPPPRNHRGDCAPAQNSANRHESGILPCDNTDRCRTGTGRTGDADATGNTTPRPANGDTRRHTDNAHHTTPARHQVTLNLYLDAATLAGLDDRPAELAGHGAITADTARALAKSADRVRAIITHPPGPGRTSGTTLDAGRTVYRPPAAIADYTTTRDRTCRFPGCRASAARCDLDHRQPFDQGGETNPDNLDLLCRTHHRLKTFTPWRAEPGDSAGGDAHLTWTSPTGRRYTTEPGHLLCDSITPQATTTPTDDPPPF